MRDAIVICTKDRPFELARCLDSVRSQTVQPSLVAIIDASTSDDRSAVARSLVGTRHIASRPGLTAQRNLAVEQLAGDHDVLHFIDDDVVLEPGYLAGVRAAFSDPAVGGVGGVIVDSPRARPYLLRRLFLLDSRRPGAVLRSGLGILAFDPPHPLAVDWLSGCSMSFRTSLFEHVRFDEGLDGYCLGEDVDFGLAASSVTELVVTPDARLRHLTSPVNRHDPKRLAELDVVTRHRRVTRYPRRLSMTAFWWSLVGAGLMSLAKGVVLRRPSSFEHVRGMARGVVALARMRTVGGIR